MHSHSMRRLSRINCLLELHPLTEEEPVQILPRQSVFPLTLLTVSFSIQLHCHILIPYHLPPFQFPVSLFLSLQNVHSFCFELETTEYIHLSFSLTQFLLWPLPCLCANQSIHQSTGPLRSPYLSVWDSASKVLPVYSFSALSKSSTLELCSTGRSRLTCMWMQHLGKE